MTFAHAVVVKSSKNVVVNNAMWSIGHFKGVEIYA